MSAAGTSKLDCHQNLLTTIELPNTQTLTQISCQQNNLKGSGMDAMIASLPDRTGTSTGSLNVRFTYNTSWPEANVMTVTQVNAARAKNWDPRFYNGGWMSYDGAEEYEQGDVTGDNKVDVEDVNAIINIILKVS